MRKILSVAVTALLCFLSASVAAQAESPVAMLEKAVLAEKVKLEKQNGFASTSGLCIGGVGVISSGPFVMSTLRQCTYRTLSRSDVASLMANNNWPLVIKGNNVEYYQHPTGWYMTVYDKSGNASELVILLDMSTN